MATSKDIGASDWKKNKANYWALTPISFLERTNKFGPKKLHGFMALKITHIKNCDLDALI